MSSVHIVKRGEHLSAIAVHHGFEDYRSLWLRGENAGLRAQRKNPNVLLEGDRVVVPDREAREEPRPTDQRHRFVLESHPLRLRIRLLDEARRVVTGVTATLVVEGVETSSRALGGDGQVDDAIVKRAAIGRLTVNPGAKVKKSVTALRSPGGPGHAPAHRAPSPGSPAPTAASPADPVSEPVSPTPADPGCGNEISPAPVEPPPPPEEPAPEPVAERNAPVLDAAADPLAPPRPELSTLARIAATWVEAELTLGIGELDPIDTMSGQLQRLHNLGYEPGELGPATTDDQRRRQRSAIEEFQCDQGLGVDGVCGAATQAKLLQVHGC